MIKLPYIEGFEDNWRDESAEPNSFGVVAADFGPDYETPLDLSDYDIKVAVYENAGYSGQAFILYQDRRDSVWYEITAYHCSCYGLEGQWTPERINEKELRDRPDYVGYGTSGRYPNLRRAIELALDGVDQE